MEEFQYVSVEVVGSLSLVMFMCRLYDPLRSVREGTASIGLGQCWGVWSEDSEALLHGDLLFRQVKFPSPFVGPHCPGFCPSTIAVAC